MSYGVSAALQAAVYGQLVGDTALAALVGAHVYDAMPPGVLPSLYVSLGPEVVRDRSDKTGRGADHDFAVSVVTEADGFQAAKAVAGAVSDALSDADLTLTRGRLVGLRFVSARARREEAGTIRRIELRFRARVED
ncbi:DUF3168 domain-containing protein [Anianabacter salinae]|uniref:DUF3168 domain-containing protein n=1 Tax=Anianabacter salinae TaxID=2851023 RepID=UPI00225E4CC1|nr:DUF3168 domain-containing protein [Anianabacter salinae]MBV0912945.1 DUF3168 domain-containing protein [Anianabacter salinae]